MFLVVLLGCITFCSSAYNLKNLNGFKCPKVTRMNQAIRLNEKLEVECFSINGSQCAGFTGERSCRTYIKYNINKLREILSMLDKLLSHFERLDRRVKRYHNPILELF